MILWKNDQTYLLNADNMHKSVADIIDFSGGKYLARKSGETAKLEIAANTRFAINNSGTFKVYDIGSSAKELAESDLDTGVFAVGTDYYVYLHDDGADAEVIIISANSTYPSSHGCNANNSRKIGGFHYGYERVSYTVGDVRAAIIPNSVWDLKHRPKCAPEGMAYIGGGVWVDIYLASVNEAITLSNGNGSPITAGTCKSKYGDTPLTGTEGLSGYNFFELARRSGKRLLTYGEWLQAAHGHPAGNEFAGNTSFQSTPLREGRHDYRINYAVDRGFNPRPCARGDSIEECDLNPTISFNPRPCARGDTLLLSLFPSIWWFNPRPCARGDRIRHKWALYQGCFNPRPCARGDPGIFN